MSTSLHMDDLHEKHSVAYNSVLAAVALTTMKLVVGLLTGSLGILAEAAHSGLDLIAALFTLIAVRISSRPADQEHLYGHGKIENLSALFETLLLLATCVWILYEAFRRLWLGKVVVEVTFWSFAVMFISIIVDFSRSRMLARAARKYNSQALEADALHFSTDIYSSAVVILGLALVALSNAIPGMGTLHEADALAAIIVAGIVIWISLRLGRRTVQALLDAAPEGLQRQIVEAVESLPGVVDCHRVRIRSSGPQSFVDAHITVNGHKSLESVHSLTDRIEKLVQSMIPGADVTVHPEPLERNQSFTQHKIKPQE